MKITAVLYNMNNFVLIIASLYFSVPLPGGEGDHSPFLYLLGIPTLSPAYTYNIKVNISPNFYEVHM